MPRCLGIFREVTNSPNRETDDALILKAVLERLGSLGVETQAVNPEESDSMDLAGWDIILPMCESYPRIKRLESLSRSAAALWVNPPASVLNCYRIQMLDAFRPAPDIRFPKTEVRKVDDGPGAPPAPSEGGWWVKRGDVHNTCDHDVVRARRWPDVAGILQDFAKREITHWLVQPHVEGDLVKFYGVGPEHWFTWFYHDPVRAKRLPFDVDALAGQAAAGARSLALEVFGGDAIIGPDRVVTLLDVNSWPSFALVRNEAAVQISWHLQRRARSLRDAALRRH
jgi:hypothetical protein